jgi:hypothetical protein
VRRGETSRLQFHQKNMKTISSILTAFACCAALIHPAAVMAGQDEVTVRLPSIVTRLSSAIRATVWIPRDADNRLLRVTLDSERFYRSSDVPLEGNQAPQSHTLEWHALPPGEYEVTFQLVGTSRVRQVVRRQLQVIGL